MSPTDKPVDSFADYQDWKDEQAEVSTYGATEAQAMAAAEDFLDACPEANAVDLIWMFVEDAAFIASLGETVCAEQKLNMAGLFAAHYFPTEV